MSEAFASLSAIVAKMPGLTKPRIEYMSHVLHLFLSLRSRINFLMLARHSSRYVESTYRLHFEEFHDFAAMNVAFASQHGSGHFVWAFDASYLPKSGTKTPHVGKYWSGSAAKALWGLEAGLLSLVDIAFHTAFHVDVALTPDRAERQAKGIDLLDHYSQVISWSSAHLLTLSRYLTVDAYFAKKEFVDQVRRQTGLHVISLLRQDANLRYLYRGPKSTTKGAPKRYDGKIDLKEPDLSRFELVAQCPTERIYSAQVYCVFLKAVIRLAYVQQLDPQGQLKAYRPFFSTDSNLSATVLVGYYQARFQQEFLIRDSKQFTGLTDCQARSVNKIEHHLNLSLSALNVAKVESGLSTDANHRQPFSMASVKTRYHNQLLLERFIDILPEKAKMHINQDQLRTLCSFGCIAA
jgi:Transposase DDE domain